MSQQQQDESTRTAFAVLIPLVILLVAVVVGIGINKAKGKPAPKAATAPVAVAVDEARVVVADGMVKFYFASGKADLARDGAAALAAVAKDAAAGKKLAISGFHDATGDAVSNAELAKQRALAVQALLVAAGVAEAGIELRKPEVLTGTGDLAEARRVEVVVLP